MDETQTKCHSKLIRFLLEFNAHILTRITYLDVTLLVFLFHSNLFCPFHTVKAENTGIGHVYHNKGGILLQFVVRQSTRLTIATAHLAAHEGITHYRARNDSVREILRGARPNPKHLVGYDAATVSHHMFFMGDLNYRVRMPPPPAVDSNGNVPDNKEAQQQAQVQRALNLVQAGDYETLYQYDELSAGLKNKEVLCQFQTLPCQFSPTFKMLRQEGFHYKTQRIPR